MTTAPTRARAHRSLVTTVVSLAATTGVTSILGVAYWWLAAHRASLGAVGNGSAAVSAMTLVGTFGMAGLNTTLIPHLARKTRDGDGLLSAGLCAAALFSAVLAAGLWLVTVAIGGGFAPYLHSGPEALVFIGGSALTGAGLVLDEALLGLVGGTPQLWRNCTFAVTKLVALVGLTALWHDQLGTSILTAWVAGTALSLVVAAVLLRRRGVRLMSRPNWARLRQIGHASARNTWLNNMAQAPVLLTPILVTGLLGAEDGGAFYVASTVMTVVVMLSFHFTTALYAANAADPRGLAAKLRFTLRVCLLGGVAGVPLVIVAARPLLHVFGPRYAALAAVPLGLMVVGYFGSVLKNHYIALLRIHDEINRAAVYATVTCALRLGALVAGALAGGLTGVALALLAVMTAEGLYTVPALRRALRAHDPARTAQHQTGTTPQAKTVPQAKAVPQAKRLPQAKTLPQKTAVVYYLQTHSRPAQVTRLVQAITAGSPDAVVLISHDAAGAPLDTTALQSLGNVHVLLERGGYGDFSHLDRYLAAVDWLDDHGIDYDWLENLTGQDYPLRPVGEIEDILAATESDGYLQYAPVFPDRLSDGADRGAAGWFSPCGPFDAAMRYDCRHWRLGRPTPAKRRLLRPLAAVNLVQPWVRVSTAYASVGIRRRRRTVFGPDFPCYGGSFFCTLRAGAARYVRDYARANPETVAFFRQVLAPEEVFLQSVLVSSGRFRFNPGSVRYIDWTGSKFNHPKLLGTEDLGKMLASGAHWARKLDLEDGTGLFDLLDQRIRRGPVTQDEDHACTGVYARR
jgi:O-antigen/teichoic acid export membrane protein